MEQVQKQKQTTEESEEEISVETPNAQADLSLTDDLLDEIDSLLEENASEFVKGFVQKGGE